MSERYELKIRMPDTLPDYRVSLKSETHLTALAEMKEIIGELELHMPWHDFSVYDFTLFIKSNRAEHPIAKEDANSHLYSDWNKKGDDDIVLPPVPAGFFSLREDYYPHDSLCRCYMCDPSSYTDNAA